MRQLNSASGLVSKSSGTESCPATRATGAEAGMREATARPRRRPGTERGSPGGRAPWGESPAGPRARRSFPAAEGGPRGHAGVPSLSSQLSASHRPLPASSVLGLRSRCVAHRAPPWPPAPPDDGRLFTPSPDLELELKTQILNGHGQVPVEVPAAHSIRFRNGNPRELACGL